MQKSSSATNQTLIKGESTSDPSKIYSLIPPRKRHLTPNSRVRSTKVIIPSQGSSFCHTPQISDIIPFITCGSIPVGFQFPLKNRLKNQKYLPSKNLENSPTRRTSDAVGKEFSPEARTDSTMANSWYSNQNPCNSISEDVSSPHRQVESLPGTEDKESPKSVRVSYTTMSDFHQIVPKINTKSVLKSKLINCQEKIYKLPNRAKTPNIRPRTPEFYHSQNPHNQESIQEYFAGSNISRLKRKGKNDDKKLDFSSDFVNIKYLLAGHKNSVNCVEVWDENIWSGSKDCKINVWNFNEILQSNKKIIRKPVVIGKHHGSVNVIKKCSNLIASGGQDCYIKLWSPNYKELGCLKTSSSIKSLESLYSNKLISGSLESITAWDLAKQTHIREPITEHLKKINSLTRHTEFTFISGSDDSTIKLWDLRVPRSILTLISHENPITCTIFTSQFTFLSGSLDKSIKEWDIRVADVISTRQSNSKIYCMSAIGLKIAAGGNGIEIWDENKHKDINFHEGRIKCLCYDGSQKLLFSSSTDNIVAAWSFKE
ncbi:unnamed protein product [Blepharisma stoltei]|uniref:Uncharacterized protein n=1 Tax=Blepharisma stoltei TaxID=1481888 RepID=A0AAU9JSR1_9CILI|nr:unnamed protein product [Blepharisma stoltei]